MKVRQLLFSPLLFWMIVGHTQNVGVGTSSPTERLHVAGNMRADTAKANVLKITPNAGDGKILTSDANGNASWQSKTLSAGNLGYGLWGDCAGNGNLSDFQPVLEPGILPDEAHAKRVGISGNFAVVSVYDDDIGSDAGKGSVIVYQFDGTRWVFMQQLEDPNGGQGFLFGFSVAISGNYIIAGSINDHLGTGISTGSASIFRFNGTSWVFLQKLTDAGGANNDQFGYSVSISPSGAIVGAPHDDVGSNADQGSACVYSFNVATYVFETKFTDPSGAANDQFGTSVAIDNFRAVVGTPWDDGPNLDQGSAIAYVKIVTWFGQKLTDPSGGAGNFFGQSVSVQGNELAIGSNNKAGKGAVFVYTFVNNIVWTLQQTILEAIVEVNDSFGESIKLSGNYMIVGMPRDERDPADDIGGAMIYIKLGSEWSRLQYVSDPTGNDHDNFGEAVSIDGVNKRFIVGVPGFGNNGAPAYANEKGKVVFGKVN
jgi:hypothetical protein